MTQTVALQNILRYILNSTLGNKYAGYRCIYRVFTDAVWRLNSVATEGFPLDRWVRAHYPASSDAFETRTKL